MTLVRSARSRMRRPPSCASWCRAEPTTASSARFTRAGCARTTRCALRLFGHEGAPGASQAFACERDALLVVAAPGGRRRGRRSAGVRARGGGQARHAAQRGRGGAAGAARRAAARLPRGSRERAVLRGARGRVHPGDRRARAPVLGLPRLPQAEARERSRARHGRRDHAHADGRRLSAARALRASSSTWTWTRSCRWCATRSAATTRSGSPARRATTRTWATPAT